MTKWEYRIERWRSPFGEADDEDGLRKAVDKLNSLGDEGWELAHYLAQGTHDAIYVYTIWKRQR